MHLSYHVEGNGKPVLFLHGFLESSSMWDGVVLPIGVQAIKIDLPGHGDSVNSELLCTTIDEMAQKISQLIDELDLTEFDVIGHSMGGYVALSLKKNDPRCSHVLLLNSNFWQDNDARKQDRHRIAELVKTSLSLFIYTVIPGLFLDPEKHDLVVKKLVGEALKMSPEAIGLASIAMSNREDHAQTLLKNPTNFTIIQGNQDSIVTLDEMRSRLTGIDVKVIELEGTGHMAHIECRQEVEKQIALFLDVAYVLK